MPGLIYGALCALFFATLPLERFPGQETLKALPILLLALLIYRAPHLEGRFKRLLVPAFVFSAAGDVFLHLVDLPASFLLGLGSFLVAHVCFIAANVRWPGFAVRKLAGAVLVALMLITMMVLVRPGAAAAGLYLPTLLYGSVLAAMAVTALFATPGWTLGVGGLLFVASDSLIAWSKFVAPVPADGALIMLTYYASQFLMFKAYLASAPRSP